MSHQESLTRYVANFVDELALSGVDNIVISPGSRSTPLAMLANAHEKLEKWVLVDERSAAFFALGMARRTGKAVALICTSGTAAANYFPAVIEAFHARIPLIVLTADRPHELRGVGAPQAMDQIRLYGEFVKDFIEMAAPSDRPKMIKYARKSASRAVRLATTDTMGPVQLNFPFEEPLLPNLDLPQLWGERLEAYNPLVSGVKSLTREQLAKLKDTIEKAERPLFVVGPQADCALIKVLNALGKKLSIPVLADPVSQGRSNLESGHTVIASYDAVFRTEEMRQALKADLIIRFGAMPISKMYRFYIEAHSDVAQYVVEAGQEVLEPTNDDSHYLLADGETLCRDLFDISERAAASDWLKLWQQIEHKVIEILNEKDDNQLREGDVAKVVQEMIPEKSNVFVSNSMPVRDMDTFFLPTEKDVFLYANRGVSGIDGIHSTALGMAAATKLPTTLVLGDLSFYHDMNGLLAAKKYKIPMTVILINNDGGGIFSFLPQSKEKTHFETLFGTALDIDFKHASALYDGNHIEVSTVETLKEALKSSYQDPGLNVIEVKTDRQENLDWHKALWQRISQEVRRLI